MEGERGREREDERESVPSRMGGGKRRGGEGEREEEEEEEEEREEGEGGGGGETMLCVVRTSSMGRMRGWTELIAEKSINQSINQWKSEDA